MERLQTVSELTRYIKERLEGDPALMQVWVEGEISNFRHHPSGHMYFTLKDEQAQLRCVMFRSANRLLRFKPEDGMAVIAAGQIGVYDRGGQYQLYVAALEPKGVGALHIAFEQLKAKLAAEGLFDPARKRPLPLLPRRVGIVTAETGAAIRDIVRVVRRRFPGMQLVLAPVRVQGAGAAAEIIAGLERISRLEDVDVIIVGRGGGSREDLWAFNDEALARAVARSPVPVVAAVGHEHDITIIDFVADARAPTPSAAAELVVPDRQALLDRLVHVNERLRNALRQHVRLRRLRFERALASRALRQPQRRLADERQRVDDLLQRALREALHVLQRRREQLQALGGRLHALSPLAVLQRGYGVVLQPDGRTVIRSISDVEAGQAVCVRLHDGRFTAAVTETEAEVGA